MNAPHGQGPYGYPYAGGNAPPGGAYGSAYAPPAPQTADAEQYGDKVYEYGRMKRGRYNAWPYVVLAFIAEVFLLGGSLGLSIGWLVGYLSKSDDAMAITALAIGAVAGIGGSIAVFHDRWRCIEAFSSRFCIGLMNISIMFVPLVALVYANVRGVRKLFGS